MCPAAAHAFSAGHAGPALQSAAITRRHGRTLCTPSLYNGVLTEKAVLYCAFRRTGSTIYIKLSLSSTGVMMQGEMPVFRCIFTVSAGA